MVVKALDANFAPYASARSVIDVIKRFRERGLQDPLTATALEAVGVPPTMTSFSLRALVFLGLIDEGGNHTEAFNQLRRATSEEYPVVLQGIIRKAYLKVFTVADPAVDEEGKITDAFRVYEPANQRSKMIRLFMGLCEEASMVAKGSVRRRSAGTGGPRPKPPEVRPPPPPPPPDMKLHAALAAFIKDLETKWPTWSKTERERWLTTFTATLDYAYPAKPE